MGRALRLGARRGLPHIADLIEERRDDFARELSLEQGKPYTAEAIADIDETAENFRIAAEDVKRMETAIIPSQDVEQADPHLPQAERRLRGDHAVELPHADPRRADRAGDRGRQHDRLKPSEWTPIAMANFMQIMADAGLPEGVVNVIYGDGEVGERLVTDQDIDCVGFVGSHPTAEKIVRAAGLKRSLIEASGNGPVVVCVDADLERPRRAPSSAASSAPARCAAPPSACSWTPACTTTSSPRCSRRRRAGRSATRSTTRPSSVR